MHPTAFPRDFHMWGVPERNTGELNQPKSPVIPSGLIARNLLFRELKSAQRYCLPLWFYKDAEIFGARRSRRQKIKKRSYLEVLALKVPFRNLQDVSESSPVAGTIKGFSPS
jgi:hypothetical protein